MVTFQSGLCLSIFELVMGGVGVKIGSIAPSAGIEPTSLGLWASVLTIEPPMLPDITTLYTPTC